MENDKSNNKRLWEINEQIYKQKKDLDEQLKAIEIEKEQLKIEKEEIQKNNAKLWEQSKSIHQEKERINVLRLEIEAKHKEITDSILYAERLQKAILPQHKVIDSFLNEWFVLFKPKDIVSGDFYWFEEKNDKYILAAADCTGHGVPGAMVSVICNYGLNQCVKELGIENPARILDKTREIIIKEFEKSHEEVKDGMDIALISLSSKPNENGNFDLEFAGAHNPLWIIRKDSTDIEQIKGDKQPVGKHAHETPFTSNKLEVSSGDTLYLFSDGYADQFGGDKGKKFKAASFKNLLVSIKNEPLNIQKEILFKTFEDWRGPLEQLDDVCVIGIRV